MTNVIETALIALAPGALEGLLAVAIVLTYRAAGVVNVALGSVGALGAVLAASLAPTLTPAPALLVGICASGIAGAALTSVSRLRPLRPYPRSLLVTALVAVVLSYALARTWEANLAFPAFLPERLIGVGPYEVTSLLIVGLVIGLLSTAGAVVLLHFRPGPSLTGRMAADPHPSATWVLLATGAMAGLAACLTAEATFGAGFMVIPGLVAVLAALLAKLRSPVIAFATAAGVEVVRALSIHSKMPHSGYTIAFVAALLIVGCLSVLLPVVRAPASAPGRASRRQSGY